MKKQILITSILVAVALVAGFFLGYARGGHAGHDPAPAIDSAGGSKIRFWTCAMHPQIWQPKTGDCKLCGMDLIAVREGQDDNLGPRELKLSAAAAKLADVEITPVIRMIPEMNVRMVGKIEYDESRLAYITARFPGRLDRLFVDYTGVSVNEGDHLAMIYSPKLLVAQQELIQAKKNLAVLGNDAQSGFRERAHKTLLSAREKLRLWDLTPEQIQQIEQNEKPMDHLTINAPIGGVVLHKNAVEGVYLETGARIYTIADLSSVWVKLDAYESDLQWLHYGQKVEFFTEALPGEKFSGRISFIDRVLNPKTRTVKIRVNIPNKDGRLKPDMFVRAVVKSRIATEGRVMDPFYAGKWISPMHPEIVSDKPGECTVCGMALVPAETLGYASATNATVAPLVIPASAPLITGNRAVVYVTATNRPGIYEGREIVLGPRAGNYYLVKEGLKEGELVASSGTFKIDSAIQILAKPSMMNPPPHDHAEPADLANLSAPPEFTLQLGQATKAYIAIKNSLSSDKQPTPEQVSSLQNALGAVDMNLLDGNSHQAWMVDLKFINQGLQGITDDGDIEKTRAAFKRLSNGLIDANIRFGRRENFPVYIYHCPMAFENKGASWLQDEKGTLNPYFGSRMLKCGELKQEIK